MKIMFALKMLFLKKKDMKEKMVKKITMYNNNKQYKFNL